MNDELERELELDRLHFAAQEGDLEEVKTLIEKKDPVNRFDELGKTPLHYATEEEHLDVMKFLLSSGADVNAHDDRQVGNTPLGEVAGSCSFEVAKLLVDAGANPTIPGWMQLTALHKSEQRKKPEGVKVHELLLKSSRKYEKEKA